MSLLYRWGFCLLGLEKKHGTACVACAQVERDRQHPEPRVGDEVQFAIASNSAAGRDHAVQISYVPRGSVKFETTDTVPTEGVCTEMLREAKGYPAPPASQVLLGSLTLDLTLAIALPQPQPALKGEPLARETASKTDAPTMTLLQLLGLRQRRSQRFDQLANCQLLALTSNLYPCRRQTRAGARRARWSSAQLLTATETSTTTKPTKQRRRRPRRPPRASATDVVIWWIAG